MSDDEPVVSVVIAVLDAASTLPRQLQALSRQEEAPPFEVVIADNGSTDETVHLVRRWIEAGIGAPVSARVVDASARRGIAHARNTGVGHSRGRILAFCDADDIVDDRWVGAVAGSRLARDDGAVGGQVMLLDAEGAPTDTVVLASLDGVPTQTSGEEVPVFWGCNFALTRATYEDIGGFDESLPPYGCEDIEIGLRLAAGGHRVTYEPTMTVYYEWPQGRRKLRRNVRAGAAMACVWARHPEAFPRKSVVAGLMTSVVTAPARELTARRTSLRARASKATEELATRLGYLLGELRWVRSGRLGPPRLFRPEAPDEAARTYLTVCSSEDYLEGVVALEQSLRAVGSSYPLTVLVTPAISDRVERTLHRLGIRTLRSGRAMAVPRELAERNAALGSGHWSGTFDKLQAFELLEFDKVVYLDSDMMVLRNVDELFDRSHLSAVVAGRSYPGNESWVLLNSGCLVIVPEEGSLERLWATVPTALEERQAVGDQDLLQIAHPQWPDHPELHLGEEYNVFFPYLDDYTRVLGYSLRGRRPVKIVHFVGGTKPWMWTTRQTVRTLARHLRARQWISAAVMARYQLMLLRARTRLAAAARR